MARTPKIENKLIEALKFLSLVTKEKGNPNETHIILANKTASAFNGVISAGTPIDEELFACPHNQLLLTALSKSSPQLSMTQLSPSKLSIKSGRLQAVIPCLESSLLQSALPDRATCRLSNNFKTGLEIVGILANENAQSVVAASILMNGHSLVATDRIMMIEYWHGCDLPPGLALPKAIVAPLTKTKKVLNGLGFSKSSATFWFEDKSWIKTQLYNEQWPDIEAMLNRECKPVPLPEYLFAAIDATSKFSPDGNLYAHSGCLASHAQEGVGASFECPGIPEGATLSVHQWAAVRSWAKTVAWGSPTMLFGDCARAVIAGRQ